MTALPDDPPRINFHHIGFAFRHPTDPWPLLVGALGGRFVDRGSGPGYGWTQLAFANGFRIEGIHPEGPSAAGAEEVDFIGRFLERHGPGPHHLTFSTDDLDLTQERLARVGVTSTRLDHNSPVDWGELVIPSGDAHGVTVQVLGDLARVPPIPADTPEGFPEQPIDAPVASLGRVVHAVADLQGALRLFRDGLGGETVSTGCAVDGNHWVELAWMGAGRLRLLEATNAAIADWVGRRSGRIRHLFFNFDEPEYVPGARMVSPGRWVIGDENILGARIVLSSSARLALGDV